MNMYTKHGYLQNKCIWVIVQPICEQGGKEFIFQFLEPYKVRRYSLLRLKHVEFVCLWITG